MTQGLAPAWDMAGAQETTAVVAALGVLVPTSSSELYPGSLPSPSAR